MANASANVTDHLLSISRHLAETSQRSADTLETLGTRILIFYVCPSY